VRLELQYSWRGNCRRGAAAALLLWALTAIGAAAPSDTSESQARQELEELRDKMAQVQARLRSDQSRRGDAEARIEALDREIARLAASMRDIEHEQAAAREEIAALERRRQELDRRLAAQKQHVAALAYSTYVMGRQSHLKLFLNQQDASVVNRLLGYHDYIVTARSRVVERINAWTAEVAELAGRHRHRNAELQSLQMRHESEREAARAGRQEREAALAALDERIVSSRQELARLKENEQQLQRLLREIRDYLAARASRTPAEGAFRRMKGKMRLPVSAPIDAGYGQPRETGVRWDGIMFRPDNGADVSAIFEGRVVFADWLRGFGLLLIVDHGDGFMSLYSHNESLFKQVGDWVETREVIAVVGTSGGLDRPGLYFEIRQDGEPQNPLSWCQKA